MSITTRAALLRFLDKIDPAIQGRVGWIAGATPIDAHDCANLAAKLRAEYPARLAAVSGADVEAWAVCLAGPPQRIHVAPTPFGRARALAIWAQRGTQNTLDHALTDGERAYVRHVWQGMPGNTCWMDVFYRIMRGELETETRRRLAADVHTGHASSATPAEQAAAKRAQTILHAMNRDAAYDAHDADGCAACIWWLSLQLRGERIGWEA